MELLLCVLVRASNDPGRSYGQTTGGGPTPCATSVAGMIAKS